MDSFDLSRETLVDMDKAVQNLQNATSIEEPDVEADEVKGITLSYMEDPDLLNQELELSLQERHVALEHVHTVTHMEELEVRSLERQCTDVAASTFDVSAMHRETVRLQRRSDMLHYKHITSTLKLAKKLRGLAQNLDTIYEEFSDDCIRLRLPELEARLLMTAAERNETQELVDNLCYLYVHSELESQPTSIQLALHMLQDPPGLPGHPDSEMKSARAALERAWFFAPSSSCKPALLDDIE